MHYMSPEMLVTHLSGFELVAREDPQPEPMEGVEEPAPVLESRHTDPASIDLLEPGLQRQLACIVYAGVHSTSIADAQAVLERRNPRPTCGAGSRENYEDGLARAIEEVPDWFVDPEELARRAEEAARIEAERVAMELADTEALAQLELEEAERLAREAAEPLHDGVGSMVSADVDDGVSEDVSEGVVGEDVGAGADEGFDNDAALEHAAEVDAFVAEDLDLPDTGERSETD